MPTTFEADVEAGLPDQGPAAEAGSQNQDSAVPNPSLRSPVQGETANSSSRATAKLRYHKDSLNRYTVLVENRRSNQDHYLRPKDGKLVSVRAQVAPGYRYVETKTEKKRTWTAVPYFSDSGIRDIPIGILKWTYMDYVESKTRDSGGLVWKYPIAALLLTFTVCSHSGLSS